MSIADKAARGAVWTVASSIAGRAVGVLGTLVMTRFLRPDEIGEISDATILVITATLLSSLGIGQYALVRGRGEAAREVTWHATVCYVGFGTLALGTVALVGGAITPLLHAPHAAVYVPGMAFAFWIRRFSTIPERVLNREMRFGASALASALGELTYTVTSLAFVVAGWGGMSIVIGNIAQALAIVVIILSASGIASWATPTPLRLSRIKDMLRFGAPLGVQGVAHGASRYWDNLAVSHFFGAGATGAYNMAYNLADIPAIQIGEQVAGVLTPSMADMPRERRARALERSTALMSLVVFPLAIGLGLIAYPLIALILPANKWQEVAPLLTVLTCLSVFRPITWVLSSYMVAEGKTHKLMLLEVLQVGVLMGGITLLAPYGLRVASGAVGIAFGTTAIGGVAIVMRNGPSPLRLFMGFARPLAACAVMAAAVWSVHRGLVAAGIELPAVQLATEIAAGAAAYAAAALVVCRETSHDLLRLVGNLRRGHRAAP